MTGEARFGVLLTVAYNGARFSGFARQTAARTVAGEMDGAIRVIDPRATLVRAASRTDAGVHARGQLVAFDATRDIDPRGWVLALSPELSDEIAVVRAARVTPGYDPRAHARSKTYRYVVLQSPVRDPFWHGLAWRVTDRLNHELMRAEARALVGTHDFAAFRSASDQRQSTVRTILRAALSELEADRRCLSLEVAGDGFLHKMIRIIVGTLVDVGRGRRPEGSVERALRTGSRSDLGMTAPPDGLCLERVEVDERGSDEWPDHL